MTLKLLLMFVIEEDCGKYVKKCKIFLWNVRSCSGQKLQLLHLLLCKDLVTQSLKNIKINSTFNAIILSVDIHMEKEFRINLLEHILTLYFRVRAFSFAKDVREKHKGAHKALRKRSLRTEIKKASPSTVERHWWKHSLQTAIFIATHTQKALLANLFY